MPTGRDRESGQLSDETIFTVPVSTDTLTIGLLQYKLVILGFTKEGIECGTPPTDPSDITDNWLTLEGTEDYGCLWAELSQNSTPEDQEGRWSQ